MKSNKTEHRSYYHNGTRIPSCTEIVGMLNKPELVGWANYMGFRHIDTKEYVTRRANYGTYCHSLVESYYKGDVILINQTNEETLRKIKAMDEQLMKLSIRILANELVMEGSEYGGTLDILAYNEVKDCLIILDVKTSKAVRRTHWIQLMGYAQLLEEIYNLPVKEVGIILLSEPADSPKLITFQKTKDCWREQDIFNALKMVWYRMNDKGGESNESQDSIFNSKC